jgi:hypothetical protein
MASTSLPILPVPLTATRIGLPSFTMPVVRS